jgi:hypothetical protein
LWPGDAFAKKLRIINSNAGLKWTCLHYRHAYATQPAAEGWSLFRIAKEMGHRVAVIEQYYAAYIAPIDRPHVLQGVVPAVGVCAIIVSVSATRQNWK